MTVLEASLCLDFSKGFPPGFRFHPTDEELVLYYLKRKICRRRLLMNIIGETDVYKWDPEDLPGQSKLKTGDRQWFFFSHRDRKYPSGGRSNRATIHGYWKATGKDRTIKCYSRSVGVKKTLVFYRGRAPSGERTDWVMHEYTLYEEELKRCQSVQDYYALYKLYKKSGPGPKNGEQYGAPFREEDWVDDEDINGHTDVRTSVRQDSGATSMDSVGVIGQELAALDDIEDFLNQISEHPALDPDLTVTCNNTLQQFIVEEEDQSTLVDSLSRDIIIPNQGMVPHPRGQQHDLLTNFHLTQSSISQLQPYESPEVRSATNFNGEKPSVTEEDFLGDYLEVNDLLGPEPTVQNSQATVENLQFDEIDGLSILDLYHDAAMFLRDVEPDEAEHFHEQCMNNFENGVIEPSLNPYLNTIENHAINFQPHQPINADQVSCQLWAHEQSYSIYTTTEANKGTIPPATSGLLCDVASTNHPVEANQNHNSKEDNASESWFSSNIWSFVESIPSAPASASEILLVNKAFERMSSFSRMRINSRNTNAVAGNLISTSSNSCRSKVGFICISIFGVICAILWMLIR